MCSRQYILSRHSPSQHMCSMQASVAVLCLVMGAAYEGIMFFTWLPLGQAALSNSLTSVTHIYFYLAAIRVSACPPTHLIDAYSACAHTQTQRHRSRPSALQSA